jgi:hypothetical protein
LRVEILPLPNLPPPGGRATAVRQWGSIRGDMTPRRLILVDPDGRPTLLVNLELLEEGYANCEGLPGGRG